MDFLIELVKRGMAPLNDADRRELMAWEAPLKQGLYDPENEHEACGVGFIVSIDGKSSHKVNQYQLPLIFCIF